MNLNGIEIDIFKTKYTALELFNNNVKELPWLAENLLPRICIAGLAGSSDVGKSTFYRQLSLAVVHKDKYFLGFKLNVKYGRVLYVATEDDCISMSFLLQKQLNGMTDDIECLENLTFLFTNDNNYIKSTINEMLSKYPVDLIICDTFTDLFSDDINSASNVRNFLTIYQTIAVQNECAIIFNHHMGKRTDNLTPSKDNVLGSQGFESKSRVLIELIKDPNDSSLRHMCIVKGNYMSSVVKEKSFVLKFDEENLSFENTKERVDFQLIKKKHPKSIFSTVARPSLTIAVKKQILELKELGLSNKDILAKINETGYKVGRSTYYNWLKEMDIK